jgi:hypothetical protein
MGYVLSKLWNGLQAVSGDTITARDIQVTEQAPILQETSIVEQQPQQLGLKYGMT